MRIWSSGIVLKRPPEDVSIYKESMKRIDPSSRRSIIKPVGLALAVLAVASAIVLMAWQGREMREPSELAPAHSLAYLEVPDVANVLERLSTTRWWHALAPRLGWPANLAGLGTLRHFLSFHGRALDDWMPLLRARLAVVVTGVDIADDGLTPHLAFLIQAPMASRELESWLDERLRSLADEAYRRWREDTLHHAGRTIHEFQSIETPRRIIWCVDGRTAIIANRLDVMRRIIETSDRMNPSLADQPQFQRVRAQSPPSALVFGYLTTSPIKEELQRTLWPSDRSLSPTRFIFKMLQFFFSTFDTTISYHVDIEDGLVVERTRLSWSRELRGELASLETMVPGPPATLRFIPRQCQSFTVLRLGDVERLSHEINVLLHRHLSTVASVAFQEMLLRFKRHLGLDPQDTVVDALANEIAVVEGPDSDLLFIARVKRRAKLAALIGKYLRHGGASVRTLAIGTRTIYASTHRERLAFSLVDDMLLMGPLDLVRWALQARDSRATLDADPMITRMIERYGRQAVELSIRWDHSDEERTLAHLIERLSLTLPTDDLDEIIRSLPPTLRTTSLTEDGLVSETRSPFGEFLSWLNVALLSSSGSESR